MPIPNGVDYFFEISWNNLGKKHRVFRKLENRTESPKTDKTGTNDSLYIEIVTELRKKLMLAKSKEGEQSRLNSQFQVGRLVT